MIRTVLLLAAPALIGAAGPTLPCLQEKCAVFLGTCKLASGCNKVVQCMEPCNDAACENSCFDDTSGAGVIGGADIAVLSGCGGANGCFHYDMVVKNGQGLAVPAGKDDLTRAKTKKPRDEYKGDDQTAMSKVLNGHLKRTEKKTLPCDQWSTVQIQEFMAKIAPHRSDELQKVYKDSSDRRTMHADTLDDHKEQWDKLNHIVGNHPHLYAPQQEAHCREAVMWWVHHLAESTRAEFRFHPDLVVPLLPEAPKKACGRGESNEEHNVCLFINEKNSCDWCHSTQAAHDAGVPNTAVPDALKKTTGPDDGNPKHWDRKRRCDQDQMPRCQQCEGVGGRAWSDKNEDIDLTPCEIVSDATHNATPVAPPIYPKVFTSKRKDGKQGGYSDTLIGWKTDPFCFGFFPQNDSIKPLCYRSEDSLVKYYDITKEATRIDYTVHNQGVFGLFPNITSTILMVNDTMWIMNHLWVVDQCICANPSGGHCHDGNPKGPECHSFIHRYDTFETAQYLGREKINVEWIQNHGTGSSGKPMELDHFILWSHHVWTDPVSRRLVRAWKPFNGLQNYDPDAWLDDIEDPSVLEAPPAKCKKGGAPIRIHCNDDGTFNDGKTEGLEHLDALFALAVSQGPEGLDEFAAGLYKAKVDSIVV